MNRKPFARLVGMFLAILMICSVFTVGVYGADDETEKAGAAASSDSQAKAPTIENISAELRTISYVKYLAQFPDAKPASREFVIDCSDYVADKTDAGDVKVVDAGQYGSGVSGKAVYVDDTGEIVWNAQVPSTGLYIMEVQYFPIKSKSTSIERTFTIDGEVPFSEARYLSFTKVWKEQYPEDGEFEKDSGGNDIRPDKIEVPEWRTVKVYDTDGIFSDPLKYYIEAGEHQFSFKALREPMVIKSIRFIPADDPAVYDDFLKEYTAKGYSEVSGDATVKIQAEKPAATSDQTLYPLSDRTSCITEPQHAANLLLNTIGSDKWATPGQWIRYNFTPSETGLYSIVVRFKQNLLEGMFTSRRLFINGTVPFEEAGRLRFNFADDWQVTALSKEDGTELQFYFEAGKEYEIALEVCMGDLGDMVNEVNDIVFSLNNDYLKILQLTGAVPDEFRDYGFGRIIPNVIRDLAEQRKRLEVVLDTINTTNGMKGSQVSTIEDIIRILKDMTSSEDKVAKNIEDLKTYIGNLGTWILNCRSQPLEIDYIVFQGVSQEKPRAVDGFWSSISFEFQSFIASFFYDYNALGTEEAGAESVLVWVASDRDRTKIIRNLIDNDFTPKTGIKVNLKLVVGGALLPSVLANCGPDVYPSMSSDTVINYAIRSAIVPVYTNREGSEFNGKFEDVLDVMKRFSPSAQVELSFRGYDADQVYRDEMYGLPESQSFSMLFYRKDILAELGKEVPETWDDMLALIPDLQFNNMELGMAPSYITFLYQQGGEQWADEGMRINIDSPLALDCFRKMCNMFTQYSLPYSYDFANRFRTGEMPVGCADYCGMYNTLTVFATEIRGLWSMAPLPGTVQADGSVNHTCVTGCTAIVMMRGARNPDGGWEFMKWFTDTYFQSQFANELTALVGPAAKMATANREAIKEMTWSANELEMILKQFDSLATIMNYPGNYIVPRYTEFAFRAAYNEGADPVESLLKYIPLINKEISRKRKEFGLETLEIGQTLAEKRAQEAAAAQAND
ncbi:MAG: extracellular solute-binding protein [Clostridia bacterium]|nr:extracellular solute-binding protein [Clostridia bacterium]